MDVEEFRQSRDARKSEDVALGGCGAATKRALRGNAHGSATLPFVIPSAAEGSAVLQARPGNFFRRSAAESLR